MLVFKEPDWRNGHHGHHGHHGNMVYIPENIAWWLGHSATERYFDTVFYFIVRIKLFSHVKEVIMHVVLFLASNGIVISFATQIFVKKATGDQWKNIWYMIIR